jgi:DNA-binding MarR family transcriptional regulator
MKTYAPELTGKLERMMRLYHALSYSHSLRPAQWQALRHFATAPAEERTVSGMARARASTMGTASMTVTALVDRGLLERNGGERNVGLRITAEGQKFLEEADPTTRISDAIEELDQDEAAALDRALDHLLSRLERAREPSF